MPQLFIFGGGSNPQIPALGGFSSAFKPGFAPLWHHFRLLREDALRAWAMCLTASKGLGAERNLRCSIWRFPWGNPKMDSFIRENPIKMDDDWRYPHFRKPPFRYGFRSPYEVWICTAGWAVKELACFDPSTYECLMMSWVHVEWLWTVVWSGKHIKIVCSIATVDAQRVWIKEI